MSERNNSLPEHTDAGSESQKHVLVACLEPVCVGGSFEKIPPHITVLPPAMMTLGQRKRFADSYRNVAEENLPFTIHTDRVEYFGKDSGTPVLSVNGVFGSAFAGAVVIAKSLGIQFDDTYTYRSAPDDSIRFRYILEEGRYDGDFKPTVDGADEFTQCIGWNRPHITDFEGVVGCGETFGIYDVQLFCYESLGKIVKATFRRDMYDYED